MLAPVCAAIRDNIFRASFSVAFFCATNERSNWMTPHKSIFSIMIPRFPILLLIAEIWEPIRKPWSRGYVGNERMADVSDILKRR